MILSGSYAFCLNFVIAVNLIFQTAEAGLTPLQLVLVGTALEASRFLSEVPTGVIADAVSRKLSVLVGILLVGFGLMLSGAFATFETILFAHVIWGLGNAFISGAKEAWIADEIGTVRAARLYLRVAQVDQFARLAAVPLSFALATVSLQYAILLGGGLLLPLALFLTFTMSERGFQGGKTLNRSALPSLTSTLLEGGRLVRGSPLLMTIFCIAAIYGISGVGFDRLWVAHFYTNLGFPETAELEPIIWLGVLRMGAPLIGIVTVEVVRRSFDPTNHASVSRGLVTIYVLQMAGLVLFGLAQNFVIGMIAFWTVISLYRAYTPLYMAWINQNVDSSVRATVLSMSSQVSAVGQIVGGPTIGLLGSLVNLRAALLASAGVMSLAIPLFFRGMGQGATKPVLEAPPT